MFLINFFRFIRINCIIVHYLDNFKRNKSYKNKTFEYTIINLSKKADLNYRKYIDYREILETVSDSNYQKNYFTLFEDMCARFIQRYKQSYLWCIYFINWIMHRCFKKELLKYNIFTENV